MGNVVIDKEYEKRMGKELLQLIANEAEVMKTHNRNIKISWGIAIIGCVLLYFAYTFELYGTPFQLLTAFFVGVFVNMAALHTENRNQTEAVRPHLNKESIKRRLNELSATDNS